MSWLGWIQKIFPPHLISAVFPIRDSPGGVSAVRVKEQNLPSPEIIKKLEEILQAKKIAKPIAPADEDKPPR